MSPPPEEDQSALIAEIARSWDRAKAQFEELREAAALTGRMAELRLQSLFLGRERDDALKKLGAALVSEVKRGKLALPPSIQSALDGVDAVEKRQEAKAAQISDILMEGDEVATRKAAKPKIPNSGVAPKERK